MAFTQQNIASSFAFAQELMRAKDVQDMFRMQADFIKSQMQVYTEQAKALGESTSKAAKEAATPPKL
jgi:hypothetical protein